MTHLLIQQPFIHPGTICPSRSHLLVQQQSARPTTICSFRHHLSIQAPLAHLQLSARSTTICSSRHHLPIRCHLLIQQPLVHPGTTCPSAVICSSNNCPFIHASICYQKYHFLICYVMLFPFSFQWVKRVDKHACARVEFNTM